MYTCPQTLHEQAHVPNPLHKPALLWTDLAWPERQLDKHINTTHPHHPHTHPCCPRPIQRLDSKHTTPSTNRRPTYSANATNACQTCFLRRQRQSKHYLNTPKLRIGGHRMQPRPFMGRDGGPHSHLMTVGITVSVQFVKRFELTEIHARND